MIYLVAVALILGPLAPTAVAWLCLRVLKSERREHSRREDTLVNQVCNLAGKPWQEAPADLRPVADDEEKPLVYIESPEQYSLT